MKKQKMYNLNQLFTIRYLCGIVGWIFFVLGAFVLFCFIVTWVDEGFELHPAILVPILLLGLGIAFILWGRWAKKTAAKGEIINASVHVFRADESEWYWDTACEEYLVQTNKKSEELNDTDRNIIWSYARNHIAMFLTWLIDHDFYNYTDVYEFEETKKVKERRMTGSEFLEKYCDDVLCNEDISEEVRDFAGNYYQIYIEKYAEYMSDKSDKKMYATAFSWADYDKIKKIIDNDYLEFMVNQTYLKKSLTWIKTKE